MCSTSGSSQAKSTLQWKKKRHTVKNLVITDHDKKILYVGPTTSGSIHDYTLLKQELPPDQDWFKKIKVWLDLGFQGVKTDYTHPQQIVLPHKKPRKSKKNPSPELTLEQKEENRRISQVRVAVEHAIGGMKWFHCQAHRIRNHLDTLMDISIWLCAGLCNMKIQLKNKGL